MRNITTLFAASVLAFAVLGAPAAALHQPGPSINCIAVVYDDFTFENVPWADAAQLGDREVILVKVFHDQGSQGGPNTVTFSGSAGYAVTHASARLLKVIFIGTNGAGRRTATYKLFNASGNQSGSIVLPTGLLENADAGAVALLAPQPFSQADDDMARALDLGLCEPRA